ncbi:MAG: hypothetical protein RI897_2977 [Verrucomicrobiota bacterium]
MIGGIDISNLLLGVGGGYYLGMRLEKRIGNICEEGLGAGCGVALHERGCA